MSSFFALFILCGVFLWSYTLHAECRYGRKKFMKEMKVCGKRMSSGMKEEGGG